MKALVLGTSMNVQPNASYPEQCFQNEDGKMVIVNLQATPYDHLAKVRLFCKTDQFMEMLVVRIFFFWNSRAPCNSYYFVDEH